MSREAMDALCAYAWPGNVRELVNVIERAVSFADGEVLELRDLPEAVRSGGVRPRSAAAQAMTGADVADTTFKEAKERWVSSFEKDYLLALLKKNRWNISHAAREADIDRKYFRKLMRKYGIEGGAGSDDDED
jgi:transcriptional regulator of acetoin/glycerol metabolism